MNMLLVFLLRSILFSSSFMYSPVWLNLSKKENEEMVFSFRSFSYIVSEMILAYCTRRFKRKNRANATKANR